MGLFIIVRGKVLNNFNKNKFVPIKHLHKIPTPNPELGPELGPERIRNYLKYQNPSFLVKNSFKVDENKKEEIKHMIINELTKLMKDINIKKFLKMKIQKK